MMSESVLNQVYDAYSEYQEVTSDWVGKVPKGWIITPVKMVSDIYNGATPKSGESSYWDGDISWVTPADLGKKNSPFISFGQRSITRLGYESCGTTIVPANSIILSSRAPIGTLGIAEKEVCTNQGCKSLVVKNSLNYKFLYYTLLISTTQLNLLGRGTTFLELSADELGSYQIPKPSAYEQQQIANFLDHETAKIDTLIDKQQQLIKLLKEKRQAVISHAVTKGLNPNAPMKDSGVEWLGEVPEHWDVLRLFRVGKIGQGCSFPHSIQGQETGELPWFKVMDMNSPGNEEVMSIAANCINYDLAARINTPVFQPDTIIFPRVGAALLTNKRRILSEPSVVDDNIYAFTPTKVHPRFAYMILQLIDMSTLCSPGLVPTITFSAINNVRIPLPPVDEQIVIVETIDTQSAKIQVLTQRAENVISLLKERRTALISAAVTGKIDVRNWQLKQSKSSMEANA
jgi:type I restriction enzyme S subunit